jgi:hypothetical protein
MIRLLAHPLPPPLPAISSETEFLNFQGTSGIDSASLAGRYDHPIPTWFLVPLDFSKIPAELLTHRKTENERKLADRKRGGAESNDSKKA